MPSAFLSIFFPFVRFAFRPRPRPRLRHMSQDYKYSDPSAWIEIDIKAIRHNFREIRRLAHQQLDPHINRDIDILSVVKADAYGHGMIEAARAIEREGGRFFAVSNLEEAVTLRLSGNKHRILVLESTFPEAAKTYVVHDLTPAVCTVEFARALNLYAKKANKRAGVHVKVDTGMSRLGLWYENVADFVRTISRFEHIRVEGILTHLPVADTDRPFTERQLKAFADVIAELIKEGVPFRFLHAANSMATVAYKNHFFNLARPGVMLYGLYPSDSVRRKIALKPVMSVKARVLFVKTVERGRGISYGHTFRAKKNLLVAIVSIGYSDGYSRAFSNRAGVLINGVRCPILGRVTMDQTIVDISRAGRVKIGQEAVVMGNQGKRQISADDLAGWVGTINYEIVCALGNRLPRFYKT